MAVRIRKNREIIVCAAKSEPEDEDVYIDDAVHYVLSVEIGAMSTNSLDENGADLWHFHEPIKNRYS